MFQDKSHSSNKLSKIVTDHIDEWLLKFPEKQKKSVLIAALTIAQQDNNGWLSEKLLIAIAEYLNLPLVVVYEVASFYNKFELQPPGKHQISICTNVSCMLCGCKSIVNYLTKKLNIGLNQTSKDRQYTLKEIECVSCCDNAPVVKINNQQINNATIEKLDNILNNLQQ